MQESLRCFISYAHLQPDDAFAEYLYENLREWGFSAWLDIHDIPKGISEESAGWIDSIDQGLRESDVLIGLVSPESLKRHNVLREWKWALLNNLRIFFIRIEDYDSRAMSHQFIEAIYIEKDNLVELKASLDKLASNEDFKPKLSQAQAQQRSLNEETLRDLEQLAKAAALIKQTDKLVGSNHPNKNDEQILRDRIRRYWLEGVLKPSLQADTAFNLGLSLQSDAVLEQKQLKNFQLSGSVDIHKAYKALEENFLILGEAGSGKTILLLELATKLLMYEKLEIPLVLNLSSWQAKKFWEADSSFESWMIKEAEQTYRIRAASFRRWLADKKLILLLDGLDEIPEKHRAEKIQALNRFRKANPKIPLVVSSRIDEYMAVGAKDAKNKLDFAHAIYIEGLKEKQVKTFLAKPELASLEQLYETDNVVHSLMRVPFLLSAFAYTYQDEHINQLQLEGENNRINRLAHLFNNYLSKQLKTHEPLPYNEAEVRAYLGHINMNMATEGAMLRPMGINLFWWMRIGFYKSKTGCVFQGVAFVIFACFVGGMGQGFDGFLFWALRAIIGFGLAYLIGANLDAWRSAQQLPKPLPKFLDAMTERQLMRKVGSNYLFRHDYLRQNFVTAESMFGGLLGIYGGLATESNPEDAKALSALGQYSIHVMLQHMREKKKIMIIGKKGDALPDSYVQHLIDYARSTQLDKEVHQQVLGELLKIGVPSVPALLIELEDRESRFRTSAIYLLGKMRDRRAVEPLSLCLQDEQAAIRSLSAKALKHIGSPEALKALREMGASRQ